MTTPMLGKCEVCEKAIEPFRTRCDEHDFACEATTNDVPCGKRPARRGTPHSDRALCAVHRASVENIAGIFDILDKRGVTVAEHAMKVATNPLTPEQRATADLHDSLERSLSRRGTTTDDVWVMVCEPRWHAGRADSHLVAWKGAAFESEVEAVGSTLASDYGLDDVPGPGLWVLEGKVRVSAYRCNRPDDPEEWDTLLEYTGKWRKPTLGETTAAARGYAPGAAVRPTREFPPPKHACPDCLHLHWRPEEREKVRERWETCASCARPVTDDYMLRDEVWIVAGMKLGQGGGALHLRCVEKRIGRPLTLADFAEVSINNAIRWAWNRARTS